MITLTPNNKVLTLSTPNIHRLTKRIHIPHTTTPDQLHFLYRHDTIKYLKNMFPAITDWHPMARVYPFPKVQMIHDMYPHAKMTAIKAVQFERGFILNEARLAKTSSMIAMTNYLQYYENEGACLIIAPLCTITEGNSWYKEIPGMLPGATIGHLFGQTGRKRVKHARAMLRKKKKYYIINPAGLAISDIFKMLMKAVESKQITQCIIDESNDFANPSNITWKAAEQLTRMLRWFWMATATPGKPMDVYGQAKLMNPSSVPANREVWKLRTMYQSVSGKWLPKDGAEEMGFKVLTPAVRFEKRKVWPDMPEELIVPIRSELAPKVAQIIKHLRTEGSAIVSGHEMTCGTGGGVSALRQLQISQGVFKLAAGDTLSGEQDDTDTAEYLRLPMQSKLDDLERLIRETPNRTIIYSCFKEVSQMLHDDLKLRGFNPAVVNSTVSDKKRGPIFNAFNSDPNGPDVLIAHPITTARGVELAGMCDKIIYYGAPYIGAYMYKQGVERLFSSLQKSAKPVIYWFYSLPQELQGFKALEAGVDFSDTMAAMFMEDV